MKQRAGAARIERRAYTFYLDPASWTGRARRSTRAT
jgi:hypothetical protein